MKFYPSKDSFNGILFNEGSNYDIIVSQENVEDKRKYKLVDGDSQTYSCTKNFLYSYYIFEFINSKSVKINKYMIKAYNRPEKAFPRSWVVSGFNGKKWINISTVIESSMNSADIKKSFDVDIIQPFYKIKITQIRETYANSNFFCMSNIDFFWLHWVSSIWM